MDTYKVGDSVLVRTACGRWFIGVVYDVGNNDWWLYVRTPHKDGNRHACKTSICQRLDGQFEPQWV